MKGSNLLKLLNIIKRNSKFIWISLSLFLISVVFYYFKSYHDYNKIIVSENDTCILSCFGIGIIIISILTICLLFKVDFLSKKIDKYTEYMNDFKNLLFNLQSEIEEVEDENVKLHRTTQLMIMNLSKKLGVSDNEKKL